MNSKNITAKNKKLFIYLSIHGGEYFVKFRSKSVILSAEANRTLWEAYYKGRFTEIVFILDTCEAFSLWDEVTVPNVYFAGSSLIDQKAKSYHFDSEALTGSSDRFTFLLNKEFKDIYNKKAFSTDLRTLINRIKAKKDFLMTDVGISDRLKRKLPFDTYLGGIKPVEQTEFTEESELKLNENFNKLAFEAVKQAEIAINQYKVETKTFVFKEFYFELFKKYQLVVNSLVGVVILIIFISSFRKLQ